MHPNPRRVIPVILLLALAGGAGWYFFGGGRAATDSGALSASGTIEAAEVNISPEVGGRVRAVNVGEGDPVEAGEVLIQFDTTLLEAQRTQTAAALNAAQAGATAARSALDAATANLSLLKAGASAEQLAVAQTVVDKAQIALDAAQEAYADLSEAAHDTANGKALKLQLDQAQATLDNARAQYNLLAAGTRPEQMQAALAQVEAAGAQADAAQAQVDAAQAALHVLDVQIAKLTLIAPVNGVVLARAIEPGEVASPGATLLVIGRLDDLTITVYVPADRYGTILLGQTAQVSVDSFSDDTFTATVTRVADRFEFTPRNVQTAEGRKSTVFAVKLTLESSGGKLKPGMPADVYFGN